MGGIQRIDKTSVHRIASGQVVVDLQTAVKELVENSIDAGATSIEVRFKEYGLKSIEVVDNGTGISSEDHNVIGHKHFTSKLSKYEDLLSVTSFGFRGEALSSLCALCDSLVITTATTPEAPIGTVLELDRNGTLKSGGVKVARQRGTTIIVTGIFVPLPVRRAELTRNIKREYSKALNLLHSYALLPCIVENNGIRLTVSNQGEGGKKVVQFRTNGSSDLDSGVSALWGPKCLGDLVPLNLSFIVEPEKSVIKRPNSDREIEVSVNGLISKFSHGFGRASADRQFFYINSRPCVASKIQKVFNEVYHSFNTNQYPFVIANILLPTNSYDVNVSPDKRTIFLHSESNLVSSVKAALEETFSPSRSTYAVYASSTQDKEAPPGTKLNQLPSPRFSATDDTPPSPLPVIAVSVKTGTMALFADSEMDEESHHVTTDTSDLVTGPSRMDPCSPLNMEASVEIRDSDDSLQIFTVKNEPDEEMDASPSVPSEDVLSANMDNFDHRKRKRSDSTSAASSPDGQRLSIPSLRTPIASSSSKTSLIQTTLTQRRSALSRPVGRGIRTSSGALTGFAFPGAKSARGPTQPTYKPDDPILGVSAGQSVAPRDSADLVQSLRNRGVDMLTDDTFNGQSSMDPSKRVIVPSEQLSEQLKPSTQPIIEIIKTTEHSDWQTCTLHLSTDRVLSKWKGLSKPQIIPTAVSQPQHVSGDIDLKVAGLGEKSQKCEDVLSRVIGKDDFGDTGMQVIGQFNLGFIVTRLNRGVPINVTTLTHDDLFIVDQHAADEKYNFEMLQSTTKIQCQSLIRPRPMELSAADEIIAMDNLEILRANGFELEVAEDLPVGKRLKLVAQPQSKGTVFDIADLEELLSLMQDKAQGEMVRCSKARNMFASRACRKSIMIGKTLNIGQMTTVVRHMGTMDQPWTCPHGRPTMRHLVDLREFSNKGRKEMDWKGFGLFMASG